MLNGEAKLVLFLAIYPEDSRILGSCRGEPIYAREHVHTVSSKADPVTRYSNHVHSFVASPQPSFLPLSMNQVSVLDWQIKESSYEPCATLL